MIGSVELERQLLAALLQTPEIIPEVEERVFTNVVLHDLFICIKRYYTIKGKTPDSKTLGLLLGSFVENTKAHLEVFERVKEEEAADPEIILKHLRELADGRKLFDAVSQAARLLGTEQVQEAKTLLKEALLELQEGETREVDRGEYVEDFETRWQNVIDRKEHPEKYKGILTGIPLIDKHCFGLWPGELGVISGESSAGKSFLLLEIAKTAFLADKKVLTITIEMGKEAWERRLDGRLTKIPITFFKVGELSEEQMKRWRETVDEVKRKHYENGARLWIVYMPHCTPDAIEAEVARRIQEGLDLLVVDYLNMVTWPRRAWSEQQELGEIAKALHGIAGKYKIPVWTAAQKKTTEYRKANMDLTSVGYSAKIIHVADVVVGMTYTPETGELLVYLLKQRDGVAFVKETYIPDFSIGLFDKSLI